MRKIVFLLGLFWIVSAAAYAGDFSFGGYLKNETSLGLDTFNEVTKFKNIVLLQGEYKFNDKAVFFAGAKYWYDAVYDWYSKYDKAQDQMGHIQRTDWLRDCYLDYNDGPWFLRLGKQQVAWGQADGVTILDRVNPFDLTEYWLSDFVDLRIPLWMANINYSPKLNSNLQLLVVPDFEESTAAPPDAPFAFRSYRLFDNWRKGQTSVDVNSYFPGKRFQDSTIGVQWSDRVGDLNYTLNFLYGYYYTARNTTSFLSPGRWRVKRDFKLWRIYGGSFNKTFTNPGPMQGITLRGDLAYYNDEPTYYGVDGSSSGYNRWDNLFWLIGIDKYVVTNWLASFQFAQYIMQDAKPGTKTSTGVPCQTLNAYTYGPQDQVENIFTLKISTDFLNERLKPEVLWSFTDDDQGRLSPKLTYEIRDNLFATVGIHYFYGHEQDSNGQYRYSSQFYTQLKYTF